MACCRTNESEVEVSVSVFANSLIVCIDPKADFNKYQETSPCIVQEQNVTTQIPAQRLQPYISEKGDQGEHLFPFGPEPMAQLV